jgi:hypothetical protein
MCAIEIARTYRSDLPEYVPVDPVEREMRKVSGQRYMVESKLTSSG